MILLLAMIAAQPDRIELRCGGGGSANKLDGATATMVDNRGYSATANVLTQRRDDFADQVDVIVDGDASKIRLPRIMLPPVHGGDGGWFKLKGIDVGEDSISASAAVNFMNNPKVHIDRRTGSISIDGKAGHYQGQCEKLDATGSRRF